MTKTVDHHHDADPTGGLTSTYFYDAAGNLTETYGPGSATEFAQAGNKPTSAPHTLTEYDGGITGLGAAWYDNDNLGGVPKAHTTNSLNNSWGTGSPASALPANGFSGRLTGEVTVPGTNNATVTVTADGARLFVDDDRIVNTWGGPY
ncbi:MAG: PA14 domain-containing protein, partial [Actinomycetota bacterium]|nr:PA14 domain-containing protein [Actinomycetota bacterium]